MSRPAIALDLDGVIWRGQRNIPGCGEAVAALREAGHRIGFVSNNSTAPIGAVVRRLGLAGVGAEAAEVITSAQAAAAHMRSVLPAGAAVLVIGEPGVGEALAGVGLSTVESRSGRPVEGVIAGLDRAFDYAALDAALQAIESGAVFVATNTDPTLPVENGVRPGSGAIVAAIAAASGVEPVVAGKPHRPIADLVRERLGPWGVMVGDRPDTDGALARALGWPFGLVLTGVSADASQSGADLVAQDLLSLVPELIAGAGGSAGGGPQR